MKKSFRRKEFLARSTRNMVEAFVAAWIIRSWLDPTWGDVGTWLWWLNFSLSSIVVLIAFTLLLTRAKPVLTDREIVDRYLKRNDMSLITNEMAESLIPGVYATPYVAPNTAIFAHPDTLARITRDFGPILFRREGPVDNKHLPGCRKRNDPEAKCICGERGFGGTNPMPPKFAEEWRLLHEDEEPKAEKSRFKACGQEWFTLTRCPKRHLHDGKHRCTRNKAHLIGPDPRCLCDCGMIREGDGEPKGDDS